jgi:hypothetical protein
MRVIGEIANTRLIGLGYLLGEPLRVFGLRRP